MCLRTCFLKTKTVFFQLIFGLTLLMAGGGLLFLHRYPGTLSNTVAWLETDGMLTSTLFGVGAIAIGLWTLSRSISYVCTHRITYSRGPLVCSLESGLLEQTVQRLWEEYFNRPDLRAYVSIHGKTILVTGETPDGWTMSDDLCLFLSHNLLRTVGYWGAISLHTSPKDL